MSLDQLRMQSMSPQEQSVFVTEVAEREKNVGLGYLLWFLFGFHYAYVGKWVAQVLFWLTGGGLFLWWIVDLFRVPSIVAERNREIRDEVAFSIVSLRSGGTSLPTPSTALPLTLPHADAAPPKTGDLELDLAAKIGVDIFVVRMALPLVLGGALVGCVAAGLEFNTAAIENEAMCLCGVAAGRGASELASVEFRGALWGTFFGALFVAILAVLNPKRPA